MKNLTAIYKEVKNGSMKDMERTYKTKAQFTEDLRANGYRVIAVLTNEQIAEYKAMDENEAILKRVDNIREYCQQVL